MFSGLVDCIKGALQHMGMNMKCQCLCCNKTTYCFTCKEIRNIYRKLSTREFKQTSSKLSTINEN